MLRRDRPEGKAEERRGGIRRPACRIVPEGISGGSARRGIRPLVQEAPMPFSQSIVEWPAGLDHVIADLRIATGADGKRYGRIDIDVDAETLLVLNEFEARARHRQVRLRLAGHADCVRGEMNTLVGLGASSEPGSRGSRVRISFHDLQGDDCG
jgi:hypothetical protein